ncbi:alpha/beta fold hydrolase [Actinoplanes sp. TFC3]|uniref:alpha/beta fold hydrolase n=1 Tax=Actinoplanes sp. TFC3 TaxID=1710355 RepID=UPI000835E1A9|nr:alpha/beta fold hydrolase [Actinoplanes sp. TFC3]
MTSFLLLHGGAGPASMTGFADYLVAERPATVLTPTHPGFDGTPFLPGVSVPALARRYATLLAERELHDVVVVGNSLGGWIAAELALLADPRITGVVIMNAVGISVPGHPIADFFALSLPEVAAKSWHDPSLFRPDPARQHLAAGNREALARYAGRDMADPLLAARLAAVTVPALVLWGQSDQLADPGYGRAYAAAIPGATYQPLPATGHLPQLESPALTRAAIWEFADKQ